MASSDLDCWKIYNVDFFSMNLQIFTPVRQSPPVIVIDAVVMWSGVTDPRVVSFGHSMCWQKCCSEMYHSASFKWKKIKLKKNCKDGDCGSRRSCSFHRYWGTLALSHLPCPRILQAWYVVPMLPGVGARSSLLVNVAIFIFNVVVSKSKLYLSAMLCRCLLFWSTIDVWIYAILTVNLNECLYSMLLIHSCFSPHIHYIYTVSRKKAATDFFAVTFTNIDGFS